MLASPQGLLPRPTRAAVLRRLARTPRLPGSSDRCRAAAQTNLAAGHRLGGSMTEPDRIAMFAAWEARAQAVMDAKAKPPGSLGVLEQLAVRLCALQGTTTPAVGPATLLVMGADHGVTMEAPAVSAFPRAVSAPVFRAVARGHAASPVLCAANGCRLLAVDVGLDADVSDAVPPAACSHVSMIVRKVRPTGSRSMLQGPAMSEQELAAALGVGAEAVRLAVLGQGGAEQGGRDGGEAEGAVASEQAVEGGGGAGAAAAAGDWRQSVVLLGEVGIGNTTAAAALLAALTGAAPDEVVGRGTGVDDAGLAVKRQVVAAALEANRDLLHAQHAQHGAGGPALAALRAVGGLELAAMTGACLEASRLGVPVVVDGFISGASALAALAHDPAVGRVLLLSHRSAEKGAALLLGALTGATPLAPHVAHAAAAATAGGAPAGQGSAADAVAAAHIGAAAAAPAAAASAERGAVWPTPAVLDMGMRLGEGTGAVLVLPLLRSAAAVMRDMASLQQVLAG